MQDMAQEKLITEGEASALLVNQRRQREERRRAHKKIKWARTTTFTGGTMKLTVVDEMSGRNREITDKDEIESVLMKVNKEKNSGG